ncbi:MAG TPA: limonene-1,2-epoxide hydrolase family protein [Solirubrobacteraceae bacterium]|jgi:limonene-1,2-epoxide hydrolase
MAETASNIFGESTQPTSLGPQAVVERFMDLLAVGHVDGAVELLAVDVRYENVGLPTVLGRKRVRRLFRTAMRQPGAGFEVYMHTISAAGPSVLTERTDVLKVRRLRVQLWVCGRFDVQDGQIVLWRDYFDFANFTIALMRGLLGTIVPALGAKPPVTTTG